MEIVGQITIVNREKKSGALKELNGLSDKYRTKDITFFFEMHKLDLWVEGISFMEWPQKSGLFSLQKVRREFDREV